MADRTSPNLSALPDGTYEGRRLVVFTAIFMPAQLLAVSLRYWVRLKLRNWGFDDYIILASLFMQIVFGVLCIGTSAVPLRIRVTTVGSTSFSRGCEARGSWISRPIPGIHQSGKIDHLGEILARPISSVLCWSQRPQTGDPGSLSPPLPQADSQDDDIFPSGSFNRVHHLQCDCGPGSMQTFQSQLGHHPSRT